MQIQEEFSLEAVLSVISGINYTNDFNEVFELYWFMFEDPFINMSGICNLKDTATRHILTIHPELKSVIYNRNMNIDEWLDKQRQLFGNSLLISIVGEPIIELNKQPILK